ncbi:MAG: AbrB family transcriptional regulator [Bacteroidetes bacterium]|nr:AbrB family transcriptional regulator [Bacteroidota bacterium]
MTTRAVNRGVSPDRKTPLVRMTSRGSVTLPPAVREKLPEDVMFDVVTRDDGVIELRPKITINPSQAWFHSKRWQQMEREADEDIANGRVERFESGEDFLAALEAEDARLRAEGR